MSVFTRPDPVARHALDLYAHASLGDRLHLRVRWATCPIPPIDAVVPRAGRVLEVGCGHGLVSAYLALASPEREVVGVDIDERKLAIARHAAEHLAAEPGAVEPSAGRLSFAGSADGAVPPGPWDAIVIVDVLYLLGREAEETLLTQCLDALAPGGVLVLKETDVVPAWKHRLAQAQELVSTKVLRITEGDALSFTPVSELAHSLRARGCAVTVERVDRGQVHPHALLVARPH